jgi:RHS repeat-associated protein
VQAPDPNITIVGITATAKHTSVDKSYEIANHLGNVLATLSDRHVAVDEASYHSFTGGYVSSGPDGEADAFAPDVLSYSDYYPFGMQMPGRNASTGDYRYGFGGQEKDDEVSGSGNSYTAEFWQYDSRLGRRWNVDPVVKEHESPYAAFANSPMWIIDPTGADSTYVEQGENGTYNVVGGSVDDDHGIYLLDEDGKAGELIGYSATPESYYDSETKDFMGVIDPADNSHQKFVASYMGNGKSMGLFAYMYLATGGSPLDFKVTNGTDEAKYDKKLDYYRGGPLAETNNGLPIYASARDVGNMLAGYTAGIEGLSWAEARYGFDMLETKQWHGTVKTILMYPNALRVEESTSTQFGQALGYRLGRIAYDKARKEESSGATVTLWRTIINLHMITYEDFKVITQ